VGVKERGKRKKGEMMKRLTRAFFDISSTKQQTSCALRGQRRKFKYIFPVKKEDGQQKKGNFSTFL
jgi:hypothetical protein